MHFNDRNDIIQLTPEWTGERFPDGRPKVPDHVLERIRKITLEEAWGYLWSKGYKYQFQGDFTAGYYAREVRQTPSYGSSQPPRLDTRCGLPVAGQ